MAPKTKLWDPAEYLTTPSRIAAYLEAAFKDGDPSLIAAALSDIARAIGMTQLASQAGVTRKAPYKAHPMPKAAGPTAGGSASN
jgi:probable addiction module antidote protein